MKWFLSHSWQILSFFLRVIYVHTQIDYLRTQSTLTSTRDYSYMISWMLINQLSRIHYLFLFPTILMWTGKWRQWLVHSIQHKLFFLYSKPNHVAYKKFAWSAAFVWPSYMEPFYQKFKINRVSKFRIILSKKLYFHMKV